MFNGFKSFLAGSVLTLCASLILSCQSLSIKEHSLFPIVKSALTVRHNQTLCPMCQYPRPLNFVWTNSLTEGQFGTFRFGIGLSKDAKAGSKKARETITHFVQVGVNEQLYVTVTAETNLSNAMLITTSCQLVSGQNSSRTYLIREGCLDNWIAKEVRREDMEVVFSPHLFRLPLVPGSFMVLITCELKLCRTTNQSQPCGSNCALTPPHHQPIRSLLETGTHHVTSRPIHIVRELRETATNYAALVIGLVLGGTVVAVVVLLVRKSFGGVRRRNASLDL
ncbi:uncharacterized protein LOC142463932 isoform X1 [Ascaphus truei]|uniref:uncharacterized protein LOC142463932 isoform X1 n=1 Tax=Ascaphus truei TaxID=8439 RepID=UPI003F5A2802